jgi:hypothetical protein
VVRRLTAIARVATVLGSIPASSGTDESECKKSPYEKVLTYNKRKILFCSEKKKTSMKNSP